MKSVLSVVAAVGSVLIVSCGWINKDDDSSPSPSSAAPAPGPGSGESPETANKSTKDSIIGTWVGACEAKEDSSTQNIIEIKADSIKYGMASYDDTACKTKMMTILFAGPTSKMEVSSKSDKAINAEFTMANQILIPGSDFVANGFNQAKSCGKTDWKEGVEFTITSSMPDCFYTSDLANQKAMLHLLKESESSILHYKDVNLTVLEAKYTRK